jgi:aspartate aminotransferase-like enzyme
MNSKYNPARNSIKLLMTAGPVEVSPRVLAALSEPSVYHYYRGFIDFFEETTKKLSTVFRADPKEQDTLILQGEGVLGLEAAVICTINPGDKVLVFENGPFGKWFGDYVSNAGGKPVYFHEEPNRCFDIDRAVDFIEQNRDATALTLIHCETPAGLINPLREICKKAKSLGILTIVDCVASLGGAEFEPDAWGIDISVSASQKCLSSSAGLTPMTVSKFAWEKIETQKKPVRISYLSLLDWKESWIASKKFPFTPFTNEVYGLSAALDEILEEGLDNVIKRHKEMSQLVRDRGREMGLKLWPIEERFCSPTVSTFQLPGNMEEADIIRKMVERHGILIGGGYRELKGKLVRIGHMGYQAHFPFVSATMDALEDVLNKG